MRFFFIIIFLLSSRLLHAQNSEIEFSSGYTYFGNWDVKGANFNFTYQRNLNKFINLYSQINISSGILTKNLGTVDYDGYPFANFYASNQVKKINIGPSFKFFKIKRHSFSVQPLISIVSYKYLATGGFIRNLSSNAPKEALYFGLPLNYEHGFAMGFMGQAGYRFCLNKNLNLGTDFNIQNFKGNGEINSNLVLSVKF